MSEYQCYEFIAIDRQLTPKETAALRSISTRAEITATRFWNEYEWGDLKADPGKLLSRYFDAHLYFANWGTHRFMLRIPAANVDERVLRPYFAGGAATLTKSGRQLVLDFTSDTEEPEDEWYEGGELAALVPLRTDLLGGDLSAAYLGWLLAVQLEELDDDATEPTVPVGVTKPSASLLALAEFLRLDPDLLRAGAEGAPSNAVEAASLRRWLKGLPPAEKDRWLLRAAGPAHKSLGAELATAHRKGSGPPPRGTRRTVAQIRKRATELREVRKREQASRATRARARAEATRQKRLNALARQGDKPWDRLDKLVDQKEYDEAVRLTTDLRDLALKEGRSPRFETRLLELRKRHPRRRGYLDAVKRSLGR